MKTLFLIGLFTFFNNFLYGQSTNSISAGPLYSDLSGLNAELSYSKFFSNRIGVTGRFTYNFHKSYGVRGGLLYRIVDYKSLDLDFGVEYNYDRHAISQITEEIISSNLEFPLTIGYSLNTKYGLYGGIASSINLNNMEESRLIDNLRIGLKYTW